MKRKIVFFSLFLLILAISCNKQSLDYEPLAPQVKPLKAATLTTTYYVATNGNDNNPGTLSSPFLTLQQGYLAADQPGDTVIVRDGTYTTTNDVFITLNRGGTAGNFITYRSEHKWGAILDGEDLRGGCFNIYWGTSYVRFQDFDIKRCKEAFGAHDDVHSSTNIIIQGCKIHDMGVNMDMSASYPQGIYVGTIHHDWTINRNLMYNIGGINPANYWLNKSHAIYSGTGVSGSATPAYNINITNNIFYGISGNALNIGSTNTLIANNVFAWTNENNQGGTNFITTEGTGGSYLTIANNLFFQPPASNPYAILSYTGYTGWIVKNNIVYGGRMWEPSTYTTTNAVAMAGNNYGRTDCENGEIDPKLVSAIRANAPNVDFSLQASSPAINAGVNIGLTADFLGNPIIGLPDIGAYESSIVSPPLTTYYNKLVTATATKNDCGTGYIRSTVTYTVAANKYSSTVSQADADAKAAADLTANKQAYANANGTCTIIPVTVYYSIKMSATATKNTCGTGYTGSTVTYTVAANKYSSTVSQADTDAKAAADLTANKQAYANANGTCTIIPVTVYYNIKMSATATKNTCGTGYTGSTVTYTVAAGKYSSTISQTDANAKASADLTANKQTYANTYGTCTLTKKKR